MALTMYLLAIPVVVAVAVGPHKTQKQQLAALPGGNAIAFINAKECAEAADGIAKRSGGKVKPDCRPISIISKKQEAF